MKTLLSIAVAAFLLAPKPSLSCSCGRVAKSEAEIVQLSFDSSEAVFLAEAMSVDVFPSTYGDEKTESQRVRWKVTHSWKGPHSKDEIVVTETVTTCCLCGIPVKKGDVFLLFRYQPEPFSISNCSLSGPVSARSEQIAILDKLTK
jgi:hypothetical protein